MALAYLLDPCLQYQNRAGVNNVAGYLEVFRMDTDDRATVYVDFNGTLAPEHIGIDNDGRAVMIVESGRPYRVEMHGPNGDLFWTQQPVWTVASGGGVSGTDIVSSDGSIAVDKNTVGSFTTYDLSAHVDDSTNLLGWIRCDGASNIDGTDIWKPTYTAGTLMVGERGIMLTGGQYFHATAHVRVTKTGVAPYYDDMGIVFATYDGETRAEVSGKGIIVDGSMGLSQDFEVSCDVFPESDCELLLEIGGKELASIGVQVLDMEVHRVFSGAPYIPGGVADKPWVEENYQEKLIPGDGISINQNDEISVKTDGATITVNAAGELVATGGSFTQIQADYAQTNDQSVDYIKNKPNLSVFARSADLATVATSGDFNDLTNRPTIPTKTSDLTNDSGFITDADAPVKDVQVGGVSVVNAQGVAEISIPATGVLDVEVDGTSVVNAQGVAEITMPDLSGYATTQALTTGLAGKQDVISDLSDIRSGAEAGSTAIQPGDLATVAITGAYSDLTGTPTIPTATSDLTNDSGFITLADVPAQVNADWTESDTSDPSYIQNKPQNLVQDAAYVHTDNNFTTSLKDKLDGIASGAEVNVQADWNQSDSNADDFIKNKPTINNVPVVTSADADKVLKASYSGGVGSYSWENDGSDVPSYTTSDDGKVLGVVDNQGTASLEWVSPAAGTVTDVEVNGSSVVNAQGVAEITIPAQVQSDWTENDSADPAYIQHRPVEQLLSAGSGISIAESSGTVVISSNVSMASLNTAGITDLQVVQSLPASTTATVLYLIPES